MDFVFVARSMSTFEVGELRNENSMTPLLVYQESKGMMPGEILE